MKLFKDLSLEESIAYRKWARNNYKPLEPINGVWHPVVQAECVKMNEEKGKNVTLIDPEEYSKNKGKEIS